MFPLRFLIIFYCINKQLTKVQIIIDAISDSTIKNNDSSSLIEKETKLGDFSSFEFTPHAWQPMEKDRDIELQKGRHNRYKRYKKLQKFIVPLLMGVLVAKLIFIPLMLKMLTAISTSALVMSKIALVATGFVALKWIFTGSVKEDTRFDLIYLPQSNKAAPFRHGGNRDDQAWDASEVLEIQPYKKTKHKYIPVIMKDDTKYSGGGTKDSYAQNNYYGNAGSEMNLYKDTLLLLSLNCLIARPIGCSARPVAYA
uniref:Uncharacterized protein n=1 Tax=Glossina brevipalpis TaxID=37001 RepID=A0A1A9W5N4_9MUSC